MMLSPELTTALGIIAQKCGLSDRMFILNLAMDDENRETIDDLPESLRDDVREVMANGK